MVPIWIIVSLINYDDFGVAYFWILTLASSGWCMRYTAATFASLRTTSKSLIGEKSKLKINL